MVFGGMVYPECFARGGLISFFFVCSFLHRLEDSANITFYAS